MEKLKTLVGKIDAKKLFIKNLPYALLAYFLAKVTEMYNHMSGIFIIKLIKTIKYIRIIFIRPFPIFGWKELLFAIYVIAMIKLAVSTRRKKKFRYGKEYGAARWGTKKDIEPYIAKDFYDNMILSDSELLTLANRMANTKHNRNKNVLVVGGSGTGKTRFIVKPNIMQLNCSYVITDPKGTAIVECGKLLSKTHRLKYRPILARLPLPPRNKRNCVKKRNARTGCTRTICSARQTENIGNTRNGQRQRKRLKWMPRKPLYEPRI